MSILKGGMVGEITGKLSNLVVRRVNGKSVVSVRPATYKKTRSKKAKKVRGRFAVAVEFSKYVNSIPPLREVWAAANRECFSAFNMIEKHNIRQVDDLSPSLRNTITPAGLSPSAACEFPFTKVAFNGSELTGERNPDFDYTRFENNKDYFLVFVFSFFDPKEEGMKHFMLDSAVYSGPVFDQDNEQDSLPVTPAIKEASGLYNKVIIYAAATLRGEKQCYSSLTHSKEFCLS